MTSVLSHTHTLNDNIALPTNTIPNTPNNHSSTIPTLSTPTLPVSASTAQMFTASNPSTTYPYASYPQYMSTSGPQQNRTVIPQRQSLTTATGNPIPSISRHQSLPSISTHTTAVAGGPQTSVQPSQPLNQIYSYPVRTATAYNLVPPPGNTPVGQSIPTVPPPHTFIRPIVSLQTSTFPTKTHVPFYDPFQIKHRRRTSQTQLRVLENQFEVEPKPDPVLRKSLADQLEMTPREVQVWFQNRRAKQKKLDREKSEGKKPTEKIQKKLSSSPLPVTSPTTKSPKSSPVPSTNENDMTGLGSGSIPNGSPNENTPPGTSSSSPGAATLTGSPPMMERRDSCPPSSSTTAASPSDITSPTFITTPNSKTGLLDGVESTYLLSHPPDRRYSLPVPPTWSPYPFTPHQQNQDYTPIDETPMDFRNMVDSVQRAHACQPVELSGFTFPAPSAPPPSIQQTQVPQQQQQSIQPIPANVSPSIGEGTMSRTSTGAYSGHTYASNSSSSLVTATENGFGTFRFDSSEDEVTPMTATFSYTSDTSSVSSGGGYMTTTGGGGGGLYPSDFDPSRRSSCPAEFMANFGQLGFDGSPSSSSKIEEVDVVGSMNMDGSNQDWSSYQAQQQQQNEVQQQQAPSFIYSTNETYMSNNDLSNNPHASYTVQSYLASLPHAYPDPSPTTTTISPYMTSSTSPETTGNFNGYLYNRMGQFGRRNSTPALSLSHVQSLPSIHEQKVWDGKMSSLNGWEKTDEQLEPPQ